MLDPPVTRYMSMSPCIVAPESTVAAALELMRRRGIRHLPVVRDGAMLGIVSDRDLSACRAVPDFDPDLMKVEEIMEKDVLVISPWDTIADVAERMIERRAGSAIVVERGRILGIFTTMDALRSLSDILRREC